jgi:acyl carrier protein
MSCIDVMTEIASSLGIEKVEPSEKLVDLGDSMDIAQLVLDLESEYNIEVPDDDLRHLFTVQDVTNYVNSHRAAV